MEIDQRLLERSRDCHICHRVVSAMHAGQSPEDALLSGLLVASETAEVARQMATKAFERSPVVVVPNIYISLGRKEHRDD